MDTERRLSTRRVYEGRIVRLRVDTVSIPAGGEAAREVVEHRPAVVVLPFDDEGNVVLVRQFRYAVGRALLEAPAGVVEKAETPDQCAQRELREEVGCRARELHQLGGFWTSPGFCDEYLYAFVARGLERAELPPDPDEAISTVLVSPSDLRAMVRDGAIQDAKTLALLALSGLLG